MHWYMQAVKFMVNDKCTVRTAIAANSGVWQDGGAALTYWVTYSPTHLEWVAEFEGTTLHRGTLPECLGACEAHETITEENF